MRITKMFAALSTAAVMAFSAAVSANAAVTPDETDYLYRINPDGNAVITAVKTAESTFTIPETVEKNGKKVTVVGVDDFAFALCDNLKVINVPDSLTLEQTGTVAFLNSTSVMDFLNSKNELGNAKSIDDVIKYVAKKAEYKNGKYTDADLAELAVKLENKVKDIDISGAKDIAGKTMILLKSAKDLDLSKKNRDNYNAWLQAITYSDITLAGSEKAPMKKYAEGRELLGMKYQVGTFVLGDANGDGVFTVRDAAFVARNIAQGVKIDVAVNPAADYNQDKTVTVRDAAAMARALAGSK